MKAATFAQYTGPEGISVTEVADREPGSGEVRVRVAAASLNPFDWHMYRGDPWMVRGQAGLRVKEPRVVGADFAGTIDAVGDGVTTFKVGDRVLGEVEAGACGELLVAPADNCASIEDSVSFEQAAAAPMAACTALQALRDVVQLQAGDRVLVWGASGGVGHAAVQIALALGASEVHGVCSAKNEAMVRGLGASRVFDYATEDVAASGETYDVIIDNVSTEPVRGMKKLLGPGGRGAIVGGLGGGKLLGPGGPMIRRLLAAKFRRVDLRPMLAKTVAADLQTVAAWLADGQLAMTIECAFALADIAEACRVLEDGHVAGKLVVRLD